MNKAFVERFPNEDIFSGYALREFFEISSDFGQFFRQYEYFNFWNLDTNNEICKEWNRGNLDKLYSKISKINLDYIVNFAPPEFSLWAIKQKFMGNNSLDKEKMDKYLEGESWPDLSLDKHISPKLSFITQNLISLLRYQNELGEFPGAENDERSFVRLVAQFLNSNDDLKKRRDNELNIYNQKLNEALSYRKDKTEEEIKEIVRRYNEPLLFIMNYASDRNWEAMKKDSLGNPNLKNTRLLAYALTTNIIKMERPSIPYSKY